MTFGGRQPLMDEIYFCLGRGDARLRLLLKSMEHVNDIPQADGVDVRQVLPSNGVTISMTAWPPKPFRGLAVGSVSPFCAA